MAVATDGDKPEVRRNAGRDDDLVLAPPSPFNLANYLSIGRMLLVGPLVWLIVKDHVWAAFWVFVVAGITDALDGYIAKTFNRKTDLGAILDPLADKVLLNGIYVALALSGHLPLWLAWLVIGRDILIVIGVMLIRRRDPVFRVRPLKVGKLNTFVQISLAAAALAIWGDVIDVRTLIEPLIWVVAAMVLISGASYVVQAFRYADLEKSS
ncbi:MAG: CDP-alcohol phosphatidyltransferase family protein [Geminicoccales bacterium]